MKKRVREEEIDVSLIILDLPDLISQSERRRRWFTFTWGGRRRRSALNPSTSAKSRQSKTPTETRPKKVKPRPTSPSTPLSFCTTSDSDEKFKQPHNTSSQKRTREEWLQMIDELTKRRKLLRGELDNVRSYHKQLNALNLDLKAKKQELSSCPKTEEPHLEKDKGCNLGMNLNLLQQHQYQQQFLINQALIGSQIAQGPPPVLPHYGGYGFFSPMGPHRFPHFIVSAWETSGVGSFQHLDMSRFMIDYRIRAAEARKRRMKKLKDGGGGGASGMDSSPPLDPIKLRAAEARKRRMLKLKEMKHSCAAIKPSESR